MAEPRSRADETHPVPDARPNLAARRRMLKRSLGVAAPVALTLTSAPVSAGLCMNASGFVSAATFASRHPGDGISAGSACLGRSPADWLDTTDWPAGVVKETATFAEALADPNFNAATLLTTVLAQDKTLEAAVAAVFLSASKGLLPAPFADDAAVQAIWANVKQNGGYAPSGGSAALTLTGTQQWLAMTWQTPLP